MAVKTAKTKVVTKIENKLTQKEDGSVVVDITVPWAKIEEAKKEAIEHLASEVNVKGYRKGKAPIDKAAEKIGEEELINHALGHILPEAFNDAIIKNKVRPALYPKFELIEAKPKENWVVRATTCILPEVKLGDYKTVITGALRASQLWTPEKGSQEDKKELTPAEKETAIIKALLDNIKVDLPKMLVEEEVNRRLSGLLDRIEKLGLNIDSYLSSIGKTTQSLREEYAKNAAESISLELVLNEIAKSEEVKIEQAEVDMAIAASDVKEATDEQKNMVFSILMRKKTLEKLAALV